MSKSKIEWTDYSWNIVAGCTPCSEGCANCYARRMARRLAGRYGYPEYPHHFDVTLHPERLEEPLRWRKPRRVFVVSMGDLFHEEVPEDFVWAVWRRMYKAPQHTYLVLTKRPLRMLDVLTGRTYHRPRELNEPLPNVWLGTSVENQHTANERIPILLQIPATVQFVSYEPALEQVDFSQWLYYHWIDPLTNDFSRMSEKLDWVIAGGETGPGARPAHPDWFRSVRSQCQVAGVPFFFKSWGEWHPDPDSLQRRPQICWLDIRGKANPTYSAMMQRPQKLYRIGKKRTGRLLDGQLWEEIPERS